MPQVFQVLKCYKCSVFQIHQTKKSNKFQCKMCGEKQSIKRHYGIGTGKDCRMHVQKLNVLRGNMDIKASIDTNYDSEYENDSEIDENAIVDIEDSDNKATKRSKWSSFIDEEKKEESIENVMFLEDKEVFLEMPQKKKAKKFKVSIKKEYLNNMNSNLESDLKHNLSDNINSEDDEILVHESIINDTSCQLSTIDNAIPEKQILKPILEKINKNSKWAQYVDTQEDNDINVPNVPSPNNSKEYVSNKDKLDNLFSLCDENDLDQVLEI